MTQNRKRGRNPQEDEVEFMPLSKRINNLHINNGMLLENSTGDPTSINSIEWGPGPPNYTNHLPESPPSSEPSLDWNSMSQFPPEYSPDLSENQNPHYFNINKLLFEMYVQRLQRGCHQI
ncbi:hypothetical protein NQ314_021257 [Rhamnusium bicolor]|uniref:Uncharacterized protein n=1 Tax=Rhamnusium bicolor TaxID=1586634 RepID=A0AAV8WJ82_9CUCU|nr:hypothetical protein NQ314_021257 [Rhamnusium bicolor]